MILRAFRSSRGAVAKTEILIFKRTLEVWHGDLSPLIDLLMGLFRGAVFRHGGGDRKQPIKQPTEMPTSTMALMGRFPSLMGRFPTLMGRFTDFVLRGRFTSWKSTGKQPIKKRGIKRFLMDLSLCLKFWSIEKNVSKSVSFQKKVSSWMGWYLRSRQTILSLETSRAATAPLKKTLWIRLHVGAPRGFDSQTFPERQKPTS